MEGGNTKKVFIWLVICALVIQIVPVNITGDIWVQTTQEDFEGGETWNTNVTLSLGDVTLEPSPTDWIKGQGNPVLDIGEPGEWDDSYLQSPFVIHNGNEYKMWYNGASTTPGGKWRVGLATSLDGITWGRFPDNPVLEEGNPGEWDAYEVEIGAITFDGGTYNMWYLGEGPNYNENYAVGLATSIDGINWVRYPNNPVFLTGSSGEWDDEVVSIDTMIKEDSEYKMWYHGRHNGHYNIGYANSSDGINWTRSIYNPVLTTGPSGSWDDKTVGDPCIKFNGNKYHMWYTGQDSATNTYRIGYAESKDGINWTKYPNNPIVNLGINGEYDDTHVMDPMVVQDGNSYKMWFSANDGVNERIGYATAAYGQWFVKEPSNPVLDLGPAGSWDDYSIGAPSVIYENGTYKIWYSGTKGGPYTDKIGYATSIDGMVWNKYYQNPVLNPSPPETWDDFIVGHPFVIFNGEEYLMYYSALTTDIGPDQWKIGVANSSDGINWIKYPLNPVIDLGPSAWDGGSISSLSVVYNNGLYQMWYNGAPTGGITDAEIGYATSVDGYNWTKYSGNPVFHRGGGGTWDSSLVALPNVWYDGSEYHLWYVGEDGGGNYAIGYAASSDGINWTKYPNNPILTPSSDGIWDDLLISGPHVIKINNTFRMWYWGSDGSRDRIGHAISYDGINWSKRAVNPVMDVRESGDWDYYQVSNPSIIQDENGYNMWFSGFNSSIGKIGYANSSDGVNWVKYNNPVLDVGTDGTWDDYWVCFPYVIKDNGLYKMWYTGHNGDSFSFYRIGYATSLDGITWTKYSGNPVLDLGSPGEWDDNLVHGGVVIKEGNMYKMWYTGTTISTWAIGYATSPDGINWTKYPNNPILKTGLPGDWDDHAISVQIIIKDDSIYKMWYQADDSNYDTGIGYAESIDGINWTKNLLNPVLKPGKSGSWDQTDLGSSFIIRDGTGYNMWYSGSNDLIFKIGLATSDYTSTGTYESSIFDSGYLGTFWNSINWNETLPLNTLITLSVRTGDTPIPDPTWTNWSEEIYDSTGSLITQLQSRYIQYRATLISLDAKDTPILEDVTINYGLNTATPPTLISPPNDLWTFNNTPTFTWLYNDSEGDLQSGSLIDIDDDSVFTSIEYTSGEVSTPGEEWIPSQTISDGTWFWRVKTMDEWELWSDWSEVWLINIDTTPPDPPIDMIATPDIWTNINSFTIDWTNPTDFSGIKEGCWYKIGGPPTSNLDGSWQGNETFTLTSSEGTQTIYIWLEDDLGNVNYLNYSSVTLYLDTIPPSISHTPPTSGILGQPITINVTITDNVVVKSATLYYRKTGDTNWSGVSMIKDGDSYTAIIPASVVTMAGVQYYIEASDEINTIKYPSFAPPNNYFNLTIVDTVPPAISHTPITNGTENQTITISATITDNVGVTGAILYYRIKGTSLWSSIPMTQNVNVFSADISGSAVTIAGVEYYIFATDSIFDVTSPSVNPQTEPYEIMVTEPEEEPKNKEVDMPPAWFWLLLLFFIIIALIVLFLALRRREEEGEVGPIAEEEPKAEEVGETITEEELQPELLKETELPGEESKLTGEVKELGTLQLPQREKIPPLPPQDLSDNEIFEKIKKMYGEGKISEKTFEDFKKRYRKD